MRKSFIALIYLLQGATLQTKATGGGGHKADEKGEKVTRFKTTLVHDANAGGMYFITFLKWLGERPLPVDENCLCFCMFFLIFFIIIIFLFLFF